MSRFLRKMRMSKLIPAFCVVALMLTYFDMATAQPPPNFPLNCFPLAYITAMLGNNDGVGVTYTLYCSPGNTLGGCTYTFEPILFRWQQDSNKNYYLAKLYDNVSNVGLSCNDMVINQMYTKNNWGNGLTIQDLGPGNYVFAFIIYEGLANADYQPTGDMLAFGWTQFTVTVD